MITVTVTRENGTPVGFSVTGHANMGEYGEDLVCAAVSAVVQTAILGITEVCHIPAGVSIEEGETHCILTKDAKQDEIQRAGIVFDTMIAGLRSIQASYPKTLKFRNKEV
jgi:Predicted ribosomal protein